MTREDSVGRLLEYNARQYGQDVAWMTKRQGAYQDRTWLDVCDDVRTTARALLGLDLQKGERVAIIASTSTLWLTTDLAIAMAGCISVPVYPSVPSDACAHILQDAGVSLVFVENAEQARKLLAERSRLPEVRAVVQIEGDLPSDDSWLLRGRDFLDLGEAVDVEGLARREGMITPSDDLTIIYTSGTTNMPKGVVLTHEAMLYEAHAIAKAGLITTEDIQLLVLPLANAFARVLEFSWLGTRHVLALAESPHSLLKNLREVRPTLMAGVPRIHEAICRRAEQETVEHEGVDADSIDTWASLLVDADRARASGRHLPPAKAVSLQWHRMRTMPRFARRLRRILGGRMRYMVSGGAPLATRTAWLFCDAGVPLLEGYGLAETSAGTCVSRPDEHVVGSVGRAVPGTTLRIADDGEILVKGPGLMRGYWGQPKQSKERLSEGWLHTGDVGVMDAQGRLFVIDRKMDLIVRQDGCAVAPRAIEARLASHPIIEQAVVYGDGRDRLTALITVNPKVARSLVEGMGDRDISLAALTRRTETRQAVEAAIVDANAKGQPFEAVEGFYILERAFSQETGELTPTLKVKRYVIEQRYGDVIEGLYANV